MGRMSFIKLSMAVAYKITTAYRVEFLVLVTFYYHVITLKLYKNNDYAIVMV